MTSGSGASADDEGLRREARILTRYLLDCECPVEMQQRYARGTAVIHGARAVDAEQAIAGFAFRHPASLPFLDAAAAVSARGWVLRGKLQLMAAILEASPQFVSDFMPRRSTLPHAMVVAAWCAVKSGLEAAVGVPLLYAIAARP